MRLGLQSTLSVDELWRIGERVLDREDAPLKSLQEVINCGLVDVKQGQCSFRHELLQRYFEAVALVRFATASQHLTEMLRKPAHHSLIEFVLGMQVEVAGILACLDAAASANSASHLFADCLQRSFGNLARETVTADVGRMLKQAKADLSLLDVDLTDSQAHKGHFAIEVENCKQWSAYEQALINAVYRILPSELLFEEVLNLLAETEQRCLDVLERKVGSDRVSRPSVRSNLFWEVFVLGKASQGLPASAILRGIDGHIQSNFSQAVIDRTQLHLAQLDTLSPSQIYLLLALFRLATPCWHQRTVVGYNSRRAGTGRVAVIIVGWCSACRPAELSGHVAPVLAVLSAN